ncbi:hypothetical protein [Psychromicrobium lacuslunae]|uniref:SHOCT domain-containing protein n=1 Tax=Psychromicrobium lacuslunae TaxID=1618207 RepID=A0A0D4BYR0_9MICC|nr:hypothetical protein [Psychromicrobium lacuslunae]AJT41464.1 hypothetical protein UM93_07930 [Psychromicrobium lacuslunae]
MIAAVLPAASNSGFSVFPWFFVIFVVLAIIGQLANARKRARAKQQNSQQYQQPRPAANNVNYQAPPANFQAPAAPPNGYTPTPQFQQSPANNPSNWQQPAQTSSGMSGFASARWAAEQEMKRVLNELDQRRRAGQISAEQYAQEREAIFRNH